MGAHSATARSHRAINISGNVYQQTAATGAGSNNTTIASYATAGLFATIQYVPTTTQTASATVPGAPSTAVNKGWRDATAEDASNQITWDSTAWSVTLKVLSSAAITANFTVIIYRISGATSTEMGRGTTANLSITTSVQISTLSITPTAGLVFAAGDKIQVEVYVTTTVAGVATPPATAVTITLRIDETVNQSRTTPATYSIQAVTSKTTSVTLAGAASRAVAAGRSGTAALSLAVVKQRGVGLNAKTTALSLAGARQIGVGLGAKTATLSLVGTAQRGIGLGAKTAALSLASSASRAVVAARSGTAALSLATAFGRAFGGARSFSAPLSIAGAAARSIVAARAGTATLSLVGVASRAVAASRSGSAALSLAASASRTVSAARSGTAALSLATVFARSFGGARTFSAPLLLTTRGAIAISLDVLNRITGGSTTVVRRVVAIFED